MQLDVAEARIGSFYFCRIFFGQIAKVYKSVAEDTVLGEEKTERRERGKTLEDVSVAMGEGLLAKKRKVDGQ